MRRKNVFVNKIWLNATDPIEEMDDKSRVTFLKNCHEIFESVEFKKTYDSLVSRQVIFIAKEATNEIQMSFGRGTINGLDVMYQAMRDYSNMYKDILQKDETMEKDEVYRVL